MDSVNSVINIFDSRLGELSSSYSALQKRIDELDLQLIKKNKELLNSLNETERLRNLLDSILQSIKDAVIAVDEKGVVCVANNAALQLLDVQNGKLVGRKYSSLFYRPLFDENNIRRMKPGEKSVISEEREIVTDTGQRKIVESTLTSLTPSGVHEMGVVEVLRDVTETKKLREELKRAEIFGALTQMANFFADEIRNPLAGIIGNVNLMHEQGTVSDESYHSIQQCADKLSDLVSTLHLLTRPVKPAFIETELKEFVAEVTEHFFNRNSRGVDYSIELPNGSIKVNIDPILLQHALISILSNAVDAVEEGGEIKIILRIEKKSFSERKIVLLLVEDTGCGMGNDIREKLFTPFFTTKSNGRGLGLTIARNFVRFHNGDIKINSVEGKGTKVLIYLNNVLRGEHGA